MNFSSNSIDFIRDFHDPNLVRPNANPDFVIDKGDDVIRQFEGCQLKAYQGKADKPGLWTIGWGSIKYQNGKSVQKGDTITQKQADDLLMWEVNQKTSQLNKLLKGTNCTQNMFDSLVSFSYNLGIGALTTSTLLKKMKVNTMDPNIFLYNKTTPVDSCQFLRWVRSNGKVWNGLINRRKAEADLYKI